MGFLLGHTYSSLKRKQVDCRAGGQKLAGISSFEAIKQEITVKLLEKAFDQFGTDLRPCGTKERFRDCVTVNDKNGQLLLWFNTGDNSTRIVCM
jgi:hypothetical protein